MRNNENLRRILEEKWYKYANVNSGEKLIEFSNQNHLIQGNTIKFKDFYNGRIY